MKYFANAKCEIKFASQHLRSKYFIRESVFHSVAISLAVRRISLKNRLVSTSRFFCVRTIKKIFLPFLRMTSNPHIISKCLKNPCFTRLFQRSHLDLGVQISPLYSVHLETERSEPSQSRTRFFFH